jgi:hypothetical protein
VRRPTGLAGLSAAAVSLSLACGWARGILGGFNNTLLRQVFVRSAAPSRRLPMVDYLHHGIYLGRQVRADGTCDQEPVVAELRRDGSVCTISLAEFADGRPVYMCVDAAAADPATCAQAAEAARRALALGSLPYNLATSNCEHLSSLCVHGAFRSRQVDTCVKRLEIFLTRWRTDAQLRGALNLTGGADAECGRAGARGAQGEEGEGANAGTEEAEGRGAIVSGSGAFPGGGWLGSRFERGVRDDRYRVGAHEDDGGRCTGGYARMEDGFSARRAAARWRDQVASRCSARARLLCSVCARARCVRSLSVPPRRCLSLPPSLRPSAPPPLRPPHHLSQRADVHLHVHAQTSTNKQARTNKHAR